MIAQELISRNFTERDIDAVVRLAEELGLSHWSRKDYIAELSRSDSYMQTAVAHGELVGFIVGRFIPGSRAESVLDAEIYNIGVKPLHHRSGIGGLILSDFLDECGRKSVECVWLEVRKMNSAAISFYEKAGFEQFAARPRFYSDPPDDGIVMRLDLLQNEN